MHCLNGTASAPYFSSFIDEYFQKLCKETQKKESITVSEYVRQVSVIHSVIRNRRWIDIAIFL